MFDGSGFYYDFFYSGKNVSEKWNMGRTRIYFDRAATQHQWAYMRTVHGFGRALEDSIYLTFPAQSLNGDTTWLLIDYAGDITAGDDDTVNVTGDVPIGATVVGMEMNYRISSGSEVDTISLKYNDGSDTNGDSTYYGDATDLTETSMTVKAWTLTDSILVTNRNEFTFRYIVNFDNDNDSLWIDWLRLKYYPLVGQ